MRWTRCGPHPPWFLPPGGAGPVSPVIGLSSGSGILVRRRKSPRQEVQAAQSYHLTSGVLVNTSYNSIVFSCDFGKIIEDDERTSIFETSTAKRLAESAGSRLCLLSDRGKWRVPMKGLPSKWNATVALSLFMGGMASGLRSLEFLRKTDDRIAPCQPGKGRESGEATGRDRRGQYGGLWLHRLLEPPVQPAGEHIHGI